MKIKYPICPRIKISEYPYGQITKRLRKSVEWINHNRSNIRQNIIDEKVSLEFDYPDYWGMPKALSNNLSTGEVDFIQDQVGCFCIIMTELYGDVMDDEG